MTVMRCARAIVGVGLTIVAVTACRFHFDAVTDAGLADVTVRFDASGITTIGLRDTVVEHVTVTSSNATLQPGDTIVIRAAGAELGIDCAAPASEVALTYTGAAALGTIWVSHPASNAAQVTLGANRAMASIATAGDDQLAIDRSTSATFSVGGEPISAPAGWQAELCRDISTQFTFLAPPAYNSDGDYVDNGLRDITYLSPPFGDGLAVLGNRSVIELSSPDGYLEHDYDAGAIDGRGPDCARQLERGPNVLYVTSTSYNAGDGLYAIDPSWQLALLDPANNASGVAADPNGLLEARPGEVYVTRDGAIYRQSDSTMVGTTTAYELALLAGGSLAGTGPGTAAAAGAFWLDPTTLVHHDAVAADGNALAVVSGAVGQLPGFLYLVRDQAQLGVVETGGEWSVLIETLDPNWRWAGAVIAPAGHPAAGTTAAFLVLESNRTLDTDRVIRIEPP